MSAMSDAPKTVHVLWGRYSDGSSQLVVAVYQDEAEAKAVIDAAESFGPSLEICLSEAPFFPSRITMRTVERRPLKFTED